MKGCFGFCMFIDGRRESKWKTEHPESMSRAFWVVGLKSFSPK